MHEKGGAKSNCLKNIRKWVWPIRVREKEIRKKKKKKTV